MLRSGRMTTGGHLGSNHVVVGRERSSQEVKKVKRLGIARRSGDSIVNSDERRATAVLCHRKYGGRGNWHGGFTLLEMMVAIGLVVLLGSITVLVARGMIGQAKVRQCRSLLLTLESMLSEYDAEFQGMPAYTGDIRGTDPRRYNPSSGYKQGGRERPEVAVFLAQAKGMEGIDKILAGISEEFVLARNELYDGFLQSGMKDWAGQLRGGNLEDNRLSMRDPWEMEILYLHPDNTTATLGDNSREDEFQGYGRPANRRPYFMSAGPDMLYDTLEDNLYSYAGVELPVEEDTP